MKKYILVIAGCFLFNACQYSDKNEKTISVDHTGLDSFTGSIKSILRKNDFKVHVKNVSTDTDYDKVVSRYELHTDSVRFDTHPNGSPYFNFFLTITDLKTREKILTMDGEASQSYVEAAFEKALKESVR